MKKKSRSNKGKKKLHIVSKKWLVVVIVLSIAVLAGLALTFYKIKDTKPVSSPLVVATPRNATLSINSEPAGLQMGAADPTCDAVKLKIVTPYSCTSSDRDLNTIITAPADTIVNGKKYTFVAWDGCTASNNDEKVCKVNTAVGKINTIKAMYELQIPAPSNSKPVKKDPVPAAEQNDLEHSTSNALSAPGCPAPSTNMMEYPYSKTYGDVVYCLLDVDVPAGSMIYYYDNFSEPLYPSNSSTTVDATTAYASCYIENKLATELACVRNPERADTGPRYYPVGFQSIKGKAFDPATSDGVKVLKTSTLVISTSYSTSTLTCGVGCYPTGTIYHFDRWEIENTTNDDGTKYYKVTTYRKYMNTVPNRYNGL